MSRFSTPAGRDMPVCRRLPRRLSAAPVGHETREDAYSGPVTPVRSVVWGSHLFALCRHRCEQVGAHSFLISAGFSQLGLREVVELVKPTSKRAIVRLETTGPGENIRRRALEEIT